MSNRYIPYGYMIKGGRIAINETEADTVKAVFEAYRNGKSYKAISDDLIKGQIPFSPGMPNWNKNKVKRLLENVRYIGNNGFQPIISKDTFDEVQSVISGKQSESYSPDPNKPLWERLICPICGSPLHRMGGKLWRKGEAQFKCSCGHYYSAPIDDIREAVFTAMADRYRPKNGEYEPSTEVRRLNNEIDRGISKPEDPQATLKNIIKGISARYDSIEKQVYEYEYEGRSGESDMELLNKAVLTICLAPDGSVEIEYVE